MKKLEFLSVFFIFIISVFSVFDLFINNGRAATFDGPIHITFIAQYTKALLDGNLPVAWLGGFANYGLPLGLFSHQLPLTLGGIINCIISNPVLTFYLLIFSGIFFANIIFYRFLRIYFSIFPTLAGITLLTFSSYRITDIYIRGDMPEIFSGIFFGLILLGLYNFIQKKNILGFFLTAISYGGLALTHPMMVITYSFFTIPYAIFLLFCSNKEWDLSKTIIYAKNTNIRLISGLVISIVLGISLASYFLIPLVLESKYLYFGLSKNHLATLFLTWKNFFHEDWFYFYQNDIFTRGQVINTGIFETIILIVGLLIFLYKSIKLKLKLSLKVEDIAIFVSIIVLFLTTQLSLPIYLHMPFLSDIQFPWRMLSVFIFLPPIIVASILEKLNKNYPILVIIFLIALVRFPQTYGKNYTEYSQSIYYFTTYNLASVEMNTIWTGKTEEYPIEKNKIGIISGSGKIISENVGNSYRKYVIDTKSPLRVVDYTFYFPGWNVYVDGTKTPIEFQDPDFRGVISYNVPSGIHNVNVVFQDTQIRRLAKILSAIFIVGLIALFIFKEKLRQFIF